ncbi:MAG: ScyD/ScyE family protein [Jatrophihabitantaceae bacterium]
MPGKFRSTALLAAVAALTGGFLLPVAQADAASPSSVVVVSGLNNPRGLALAGNQLLIAEAGIGGPVIVTNPNGSKNGFGYTGSISAVLDPAEAAHQSPNRVVTGLLSSASATESQGGPVGSAASGADGIAARSPGDLAILVTTYGNLPESMQAQAGRLQLAHPDQQPRSVADIAGYERTHDPDHQGVDTNPYSVIAYRDGWLVADAAANSVLRVDRDGDVSLFHVFANITDGPCAGRSDPSPDFPGCNFVPDALAVDRLGNVYVAGLGSLVPGAGRVVELDSGGEQRASWTGFNSVTGVAAGADGSIYVSQLFASPSTPGSYTPGVLTKVDQAGQRTDLDVPLPASVVVDRQDNVYVSAYSLSTGSGNGVPGVDTSGQVWRVRF